MIETISVDGAAKWMPAHICEICDESFTEEIDKYHICGRCRRKLKQLCVEPQCLDIKPETIHAYPMFCSCGGRLDCGEVLATMPPVYVYTCQKCGKRIEQR